MPSHSYHRTPDHSAKQKARTLKNKERRKLKVPKLDPKASARKEKKLAKKEKKRQRFIRRNK